MSNSISGEVVPSVTLNTVNVLIGKKLGRGTFGHVYKCTVNGSAMAVKCIKISQSGVDDLMEVSIMSTYRTHPNLSGSLFTQVKDDILYIFMELAVCDMVMVINDGKNDPSLVVPWCYNMLCGLRVLHSQGIIHCDIKTCNILLMRDGMAKITDYTISTITNLDEPQFTHSICTSNYRPPECHLSRHWGYAVDIWSLGCVFYELMASNMLIPVQGDDRTPKDVMLSRTSSSIYDWMKRREEADTSSLVLPTYEFKPVVYTERYLSSSSEYKSMVESMTRYSPSSRPTAVELIANPIFDQCRNPSAHVLDICSTVRKKELNDLKSSLITYITTFVQTVIFEDQGLLVFDKCLSIILRCLDMPGWSNHISDMDVRDIDVMNSLSDTWIYENNIMGCAWIASKIVIGIPCPNLKGLNKKNMREMEIRICEYLAYCLHD